MSVFFQIFVVALAITAFANGSQMCFEGFLVSVSVLNSVWKCVWHYIDYLAYVLQGMKAKEFRHHIYSCAEPEPGAFQCMYSGDLRVYLIA